MRAPCACEHLCDVPERGLWGHSACAYALVDGRARMRAPCACVHLCVVPERGLFESPLLVCVIVCCNMCILRACVCFLREKGGGESYDVCLCVFSSLCERLRKKKMTGVKPGG